MVVRPEQQQLQMLLTEAITVLCKNGLQYRSHFNVEGLLGITLDDDEVFLVSIKQTVKGQLQEAAATASASPAQGELPIPRYLRGRSGSGPSGAQNNPAATRAKQRKKRKRSNDSVERHPPQPATSTPGPHPTSGNIPLNNNNVKKDNSNLPPPYFDIKPLEEDSEKLNRESGQEDMYDDDESASSPGELIMVRDENSSDEEARLPDALQEKKPPTAAAQHTQGSHQGPEDKTTPAGAGIYASSNGQIGVGATSQRRQSPYPQQQQQHPWETGFQGNNTSATSDAHAHTVPTLDDQPYHSQVCAAMQTLSFNKTCKADAPDRRAGRGWVGGICTILQMAANKQMFAAVLLLGGGWYISDLRGSGN